MNMHDPLALTNEGDVAKECAGKERFDSMKRAKRAAVRINRRKLGRNGHTKIEAYACEHCGCYHIGGGHYVKFVRSIQVGQMVYVKNPKGKAK